MSTGRLQHRIDPSLRRDAEEILKVQGIKPAQAIILFYTEVKRSGGLPFALSPVSSSEIPNRKLQKDLRESRREKGIQVFKNKKDFFESLHTIKA